MKQLNDTIVRMTFQRWLIALSLLIGHSSLSTIQAQTFTQRIQKTEKGATLTIHHDVFIDELVNEGSQPYAASIVKKQPETKTNSAKKTATAIAATTLPATGNAVDTLSKKPTHSFKTTGYRVQVFAGGNSRKDRQTAERIGNELRVLFPNEAVYVHFRSPRWLCRMGNFRTQEEAIQSLHEVKKLGYTAATIVKGKITVQY